MELEKEVRYLINKKQKDYILKNTTLISKKMKMLDITCGYDGFDSYSKRGYICRIRQKGRTKSLEVKNYQNENECVEQHIALKKISDGLNYLRLIGMKPYLYLNRYREIRKYKDLKIFIDEFDILGTYVEIEYQDSKNSKEELASFIKIIGITGKPEDMYGGIVKHRLETDEKFKKIFDQKLAKLLEGK
jgi:adenylate cyclase class IV